MKASSAAAVLTALRTAFAWVRQGAHSGGMLLYRFREPAAAVAVGLVAFVLVCFVKDYSFYSEEDIGVRGQAQQIFADMRATGTSPPFALIDLSQRDFHDWNYPQTAPRAVLADILTRVVAGRPKLVILDVDLSWRGNAADETRLRAALSAIARKAAVPVLLVRAPLSRGDKAAADTLLPAPAYDDIVAGSSNLLWVSAMAPQDRDGVVRRFYVNVRTCTQDGVRYLPGVPLAACSLLSRNAALQTLRDRLRKLAPCDASPEAERLSRAQQMPCGNAMWPIGNPSAASEITFRDRWKLPDGWLRRQVPMADGSSADIVTTHDAADFLRLTNADNGAALERLFANRIVLIGSSAELMNDTQMTPIGSMPGMMVIANAVRSALMDGQGSRIGYGLCLILVSTMSLITFLIWHQIRRIDGVGHLLFRDAAAPLLNVLWLGLISLAFPDAHSQEFLYPQILVSLYLVIVEGIREARAHPFQRKTT